MVWCARLAPALLLHVNILLVLFSGAGLATGARLKWDPSTYVPLRELFPLEYRVAAVALPAAAALVLLLAHLLLLALRARRPAVRRLLLIVYAAGTGLLAVAEGALGVWVWARVRAWLASPAARELQHALELREHVQPLLQHLAHYHPLPLKVKDLIKEAESDAPRNMHVGIAVGAVLGALQALGVLLALLSARAPPRTRAPSAPHSFSTAYTPVSSAASSISEKEPLRAVYKNGRLVMV